MRVSFATGWWQRFRGLTHPRFAHVPGSVLLIAPCRSIHTFTMKRPIDVAFIDHEGQVCKACVALPPRRLLVCWQASAVLERPTPPRIPSGPALHPDWWCVGEQIDLDSCDSAGEGIAGTSPASGLDDLGERGLCS